jgi:hypothetical protein
MESAVPVGAAVLLRPPKRKLGGKMSKTPGRFLCAVACAAIAAACARSDADASITTKVRAKLDSDRIVTNASQIQVTSEKKVVTLSGPVQTKEAEAQAVKLARSTEGVKNVVDRLTVTPGGSDTSGATASVAPAAPSSSPAPPAR